MPLTQQEWLDVIHNSDWLCDASQTVALMVFSTPSFVLMPYHLPHGAVFLLALAFLVKSSMLDHFQGQETVYLSRVTNFLPRQEYFKTHHLT